MLHIFGQCTFVSQRSRVQYRVMSASIMQRRILLGALFSLGITILGALLAWFIIPPIVRYMVDQVCVCARVYHALSVIFRMH